MQQIPVANIRPEEGLGRKRDREGHRELQDSIAQFGVLTPITVRAADDGSGDYLLIKGQGRTLACRLLGHESVPAIVVDQRYAETEKVQQFLVENVARLKMRPMDRALLVHRARLVGEETTEIARRFGLSAATVRRLLAQLDGAGTREVAALRSGDVNLAMHAVVAKYAAADERAEILSIVAANKLRASDLETLFAAFEWQKLVALGSDARDKRLLLLEWAARQVSRSPEKTQEGRMKDVALAFPTEIKTVSRNSRGAL